MRLFVVGKDLEGDFSVQAAVSSEIDFAHTPLAYFLQNLVMANGRLDHDSAYPVMFLDIRALRGSKAIRLASYRRLYAFHRLATNRKHGKKEGKEEPKERGRVSTKHLFLGRSNPVSAHEKNQPFTGGFPAGFLGKL